MNYGTYLVQLTLPVIPLILLILLIILGHFFSMSKVKKSCLYK